MSNKPTILVTGGAGYIGSHTVVSLMEEGYDVVIIDNLTNSKESVLKKIKKIVGDTPTFYNCDIRNSKKLDFILASHDITAVMHFAGLKSIKDSINNPNLYFHNNVSGTITLLESMKKKGIKKIVFSSTASVYGEKNISPIAESDVIDCKNNYALTKHSVEKILEYEKKTDSKWGVVILRYFNPIGAHPSGIIGEDSNNASNLMPHILNVASKHQKFLEVYGSDYLTKDGTAIRDYIHIMDLADGHIAALNYLLSFDDFTVFNLGTGNGVSVVDLVNAFEEANSIQIPFKYLPRRRGDAQEIYANVELAKDKLGWTSKKTLENMCLDSWKWKSLNI